jgi:hypothetical protein
MLRVAKTRLAIDERTSHKTNSDKKRDYVSDLHPISKQNMYILAEHDITVTCNPADKVSAENPWELAFETFDSSLRVIK